MISYEGIKKSFFPSWNKFHKSIWPSNQKSKFCVLLYFTAHLCTCCCKEVTLKDSSTLVYSLPKLICQKKSLSDFINNFSSSSTLYCNMEGDSEFPSLRKIGVLDHSNIIIKNKARTEKIVSSIINDQFDNLQFVVDFDYTLTRGHFNNEKSLCSWGILDNSPLMPPFYREKASELLKKYYPIEVDPVLSEDEKIPYMVEWYSTIIGVLKECNLSKKSLCQMVSESNVKFRYETDKLFKKLKFEKVPLLIFSAGMGDVLEHVLWRFDLYSSNVKVVSNFFKYNDEGVMIGFTGDIIHVFNKNENVIHSSDYFDQLKRRSNVVLMGDSLGDVKMAVGVAQSSNVLKIGFFNHVSVTDRVNSYLDAYDIVLIGDQTMTIANAILDKIKS